MHYLSVKNLTKSYGTKALFENISFHINEGEKIGLVATNGSGKSSLLRILEGLDIADSGDFEIAKDIRLLYLKQNDNFNEEDEVMQAILSSDFPFAETIKNYLHCLETHDHESDIYLECLKVMEDHNLWMIESQINAILSQLNILNLNQKIKFLSGGQRKRIALAEVLINLEINQQKTLLLLDEPTNHLDLEMIVWLENWLAKQDHTILLITHDRHFLDEVCNKIIELENQKLYIHQGGYDYYLEHKALREENEKAFLGKAKNRFKKELEWMRKQPKARTTKSKSREDNFYELKKIASKKIEERKLTLQSKMNRLGGKILEVKKLRKSFGDLNIVDGWDYTFNHGEKIGIVGKNGVGKSTLIKMLLGEENPDSGKINQGETVVFGHFNQDGLQYKEDKRVIEFVKDIAEFFPLADGTKLGASEFLKLFLFTPEQQFTFLSKLSGGEKKRLQLLVTLFKNPNFLVLDEPTNDLDLPTQSVLEEFLENYKGCVILISHDRYFMDKLVDHIFIMEGNGVINDFNGNYIEYLEWKKILAKEKDVEIENKIKQKSDNSTKFSFKEKYEFEQIEKQMPELNNKKQELEKMLITGMLDYQELQNLTNTLEIVLAEIQTKELRWLELSEKMDS